MGLGDIFKTGQFKAEIEELKQENIRLQDELSHAQSLLTPEMQNAQKLHERIGKLNAQKSTLENNIKDIESDITQRRSNIEQLDLEIKNREKQIIDLDDEILVQDFGLYRPHYNFANALDYKEKLAEMIFSDDAPALETALHKAFEDRKLNMVNTRREFFHVTLNEIKDVVKKNFDKTVEFIDVPDAEQYRISLKMQQEMN